MALIKSISGIRGTIGGKVGENLTPVDVVKFTSAFVMLRLSDMRCEICDNSEIGKLENRKSTFIVGRDARISGEMISQLVCATLQSMGVDVIDVGLSTTPTVEMAVVKHQANGGIIITASHNPMHWNALKLLNEQGEFISAEEGKRLLEIAEKEEFNFASVEHLGNYMKYENAIEDHINAILNLDLIDVQAIKEANFSVIFDAVNSTGGIAIPMLLEKLGVTNSQALYGEPTGIFPHNPEPLPEHLHEISAVMRGEISDGRYEISDMRYEISDMRGEISDGRYEISDMRGEISDGRYEISDMRGEILDMRYEISDGRYEISDGRYEISDMRYETGGNQNIPNPKSQISNPKSQIPNPKFQIPNPKSQISNPKSQISNLISQIPNPKSQIPNLKSQIPNLKSQIYNIGFVVDPDVDRLAIVMENGEMFGEEYTLVAVADYVLRHKKGNTVSNLSSSRALQDVSEQHGVTYSAAAVGEVNVVEKMKETHAVIGGEGNGGIILPELHYGRDALAGIALFLSFMAKTKLKCSEIKALYPNYVIIKNKIELTKEMNVQEILQKVAQQFAVYHPNTIDGVKIDFEKGWVHLRPSNTEPIIRIYAEAENEAEAQKLIEQVKVDNVYW